VTDALHAADLAWKIRELAPEGSEDAFALEFAARHRDELRYVAAWDRWLVWRGGRWADDDTKLAFDLARRIMRKKVNEGELRGAAKLASAKTVAAIERLAQADRRLAATVDQWDADPWLLNTPGGLVDLRSGVLHPHRRAAYCTKITAVAPSDAACPRWLAFLHEIFAGDGDLVAYLRRVLGYALTGHTHEHALWFGYGTGANGKSTMLGTITSIWHDYAATAPVETFTASPGERHPTDLAMLRGARLVSAQETESGRRWAESRIKTLTGGDPITARFMRQDFFTYVPRFKLFIAGNHRPSLRTVDEAMRRRFNLIPFGVTIPRERRDPRLPEALRSEWPAILNWIIGGCGEWSRYGLQPPRSVIAATEAYLQGEDAFGLWLDEACVLASGTWTSGAALFASWKSWAERGGETVGTQKRFTQTLEARGLTYKRTADGRGFDGIRLRPEGFAFDDR